MPWLPAPGRVGLAWKQAGSRETSGGFPRCDPGGHSLATARGCVFRSRVRVAPWESPQLRQWVRRRGPQHPNTPGGQTSKRTEVYLLVAVSSQSENIPANSTAACLGSWAATRRQEGDLPGDGGPSPRPGGPASLPRAVLILRSARHRPLSHADLRGAPRLQPPLPQKLVSASHTGGSSRPCPPLTRGKAGGRAQVPRAHPGRPHRRGEPSFPRGRTDASFSTGFPPQTARPLTG